MNLIEKMFGKMTSKVEALPELTMPKKICYPGYYECEFNSLNDAVQCFRKNGADLEYRIPEIIMNNICYRDYLRNYGMEMLLRRLVEDAPELAQDRQLIDSLRQWYDKEGKGLAGYDIQCYNIKDTIIVLAHTFHGLEDVIAHRTAYGRIDCSDISISDSTPEKNLAGLYVSEFYAVYPVFDSYDIGDDRTYQNYVFTNEPVDDTRLKEISEIRHSYNYSMVHEHIPEHLLPILYYSGDGDYMILAKKK